MLHATYSFIPPNPLYFSLHIPRLYTFTKTVALSLVPAPEVIILYSCSTQLSMKQQLHIKSKMLKNKVFCLAFKVSGDVFIMLINLKRPTIVDTLTFISIINFMLS